MRNQRTCFALSVAAGAALAASSAFAQSVDTARIEAGGQNDWLTYHGSYKSYHYSPLSQINTSNVGNLSVAWIHIPGRSTRGLQSMPLVADGVLYYTGSYSRVFALNGATGEVIWSYFPELDDAWSPGRLTRLTIVASRSVRARSSLVRSTADLSRWT